MARHSWLLLCAALCCACSGGTQTKAEPAPARVAPRLRAPLSGSVVDLDRIVLDWEPAGARATVQVCSDPDCAETVATGEVTPPATLEPDLAAALASGGTGTLYWHVRTHGQKTATWLLKLAPAPHINRSLQDITRDGYPDLVACLDNYGNASSVLIGEGGANGLHDLRLATVLPRGFDVCRHAGDVDGDGFGDIVAGASSRSSAYAYDEGPRGEIEILFGSPNGLRGDTQVLEGLPSPIAGVGERLSPSMDLNADGYADVLVVSSGFEDPKVKVMLHPSRDLLMVVGGKRPVLQHVSELAGETRFGTEARVDEQGNPTIFWATDRQRHARDARPPVCSFGALAPGAVLEEWGYFSEWNCAGEDPIPLGLSLVLRASKPVPSSRSGSWGGRSALALLTNCSLEEVAADPTTMAALSWRDGSLGLVALRADGRRDTASVWRVGAEGSLELAWNQAIDAGQILQVSDFDQDGDTEAVAVRGHELRLIEMNSVGDHLITTPLGTSR